LLPAKTGINAFCDREPLVMSQRALVKKCTRATLKSLKIITHGHIRVVEHTDSLIDFGAI